MNSHSLLVRLLAGVFLSSPIVSYSVFAENSPELIYIGEECVGIEESLDLSPVALGSASISLELTAMLQDLENKERNSCLLKISGLNHESDLNITLTIGGGLSSIASLVLVEVAYAGESERPEFFYLPPKDSTEQQQSWFEWSKDFWLEQEGNEMNVVKLVLSLRSLFEYPSNDGVNNEGHQDLILLPTKRTKK